MKYKYDSNCSNQCRSFLKQEVVTLLLVVILFIVGTGYVGAVPGDRFNDKDFIKKYKLADNYFKKCKKLYETGEFSKAEKKLYKCLEIMPHHVNSHFFLANILYKKKSYPEALKHIEAAEKNYYRIAESAADARQHATLKKKRLGQDLRALLDSCHGHEAIDGACRVNPVVRQATLQMNALDAGEARVGSQEVQMQCPAEFSYLHGNIYFKLKEYNKAHQYYLETIKRAPNHQNAFNNLVNLYFIAGKYSEALHYLQEAEKKGLPINWKLKQAVEEALKKNQVQSKDKNSVNGVQQEKE